MGLFDDRRPQLEQGPEYWIDRIRGEIGFTSPSGKEFTGKWIGDTRSKAKRLQFTDYLEQKLTKVRDLEIASTRHPITFFFDGNDCDKTSQEFWDACDEKLEWEVIHPVNGFKSYQLISVTQHNEYVTSGGVVQFDTEWIEPQDFNPTESGRELASMAENHRAIIKENAALSFADKLKAGSEALRKHAENVTKQVAGVADKVLGPLAAIQDFAYESFLTASQTIKDVRFATEFQALSLAAQFQNLIEIAAKSTKDSGKRNRAYSDMIDAVVGSGFVTVGGKTEVAIPKDEYGLNTALVLDLASTSCLTALSEIATTSDIQTAEEGIGIIENMIAEVSKITENLDTIQSEVTPNVTADIGYTALQETMPHVENLVQSSVQYVLKVISDVGVKKSVVIANGVPTIKFYLNQYKRLTGFNEFCDKNDLAGMEIFFLPSGKEIQL